MATTPLYVHQKESLVRKIVAHKFDPIKDRLRQEDRDLAVAVYDSLYTQSEKDFMKNSPPGAFSKKSTFYIKYGQGGNAYLQLDLLESEEGLFVYGERTNTIVVEATSALGERVAKYVQDKKDYDRERDNARKQVEVALVPYRTFEKLLKEWPEVAQFAAEVQPNVKQLPAVDYSTLNKVLDLPPETLAA